MEVAISIITVCYNAASSIESTIKSVLEQTHIAREYIIIDGGSKDGTIEIINRYKDFIDLIISEPDQGIYDAMNKGIKYAKGEWINFMNAGDRFVSNDSLYSLYKEGTCNPEIQIVRGNIIRLFSHFKIKSTGIRSQNPGLMDMTTNTFHHQACLIKTSLFNEYGYYSTEYKLCSDWIFFFNCVVLHKIKTRYVNYDVAYFKMDGATSINTKLNEEEQNAYLTLLYGKEMFTLLQELSVYRRFLICRLFYKAYYHLRSRLSPSEFNKILTIKRFVRSVLRLKVN